MDTLLLRGLTCGFVSVAPVKGTTSSFTSTVTSAGLINGKYVTAVTAQTNLAPLTTDATTGAAFNTLGANKACSFVFGQNAAGTVLVAQGPTADTFPGVTTTVGAFKEAPQFPNLPDDFMVFGYLLVRVAPTPGATGWLYGTATTGEWTTSGVSATTLKSCGQLPIRPQIA